jgi:hypothetical protein
MSIVHIAGSGNGYTLHAHPAGSGNGYTLMAVEMVTPCIPRQQYADSLFQ